MESKYRYRGSEAISTGNRVPQGYWANRDQSMLGGPGFITKKIDGQWFICTKGEKTENPNPADSFNTVLKMAKKRAYVDAMLSGTAASDYFTQDIEEIKQNERASDGGAVDAEFSEVPNAQPAQARQTAPAQQQGNKGPSSLEKSYKINGRAIVFHRGQCACESCKGTAFKGKDNLVWISSRCFCYECEKEFADIAKGTENHVAPVYAGTDASNDELPPAMTDDNMPYGA